MSRRIAIVAAAALAAACGGEDQDASGSPGGLIGPDPSHSEVLVSHQREAYQLFNEGAYLYWTTYDTADGGNKQFWRCDKRDCAGTRRSVADAMGSLLIRNETMYVRYQDGIASCPAGGCVDPATIVTKSSTGPTFVDDVRVYWGTLSENAFFSCPLSGCASAQTPITTGIGAPVGSNRTHLYWAKADATDATRLSIFSVPKDGSTALPQAIATRILTPAAFIVDDDFLYWSSGRVNATLSRCPTSGCPDGGPEILTTQPYYPGDLAVSDGVLFWIAEGVPAEQRKPISRPIKIVACVAAQCGETIEVLDEARGGGPFTSSAAGTPEAPRSLVVDSEAIYFLADIADITNTAVSQNVMTESSIRRLPRKPGK